MDEWRKRTGYVRVDTWRRRLVTARNVARRVVDLVQRIGRRRALQILGVVAMLAVASVLLRSPKASLPEPVKVRRDDLVLSVDLEGELKAVRAVEVSPPVASDIELKISFLATEGASVKKGSPVVGFDTDQLRRLLDEKKAELQEAEKRLEQKSVDISMKRLDLDLRSAQGEAELGRARLKADVPPEVQMRLDAEKASLDRDGRERDLRNLMLERQAVELTAGSELRSLQSRRDRAQGRVAELERSIEQMTVRAPQDGIVILTADWNGEKKKVGDPVWSMQSILSIPDLREMRALGSVDEADGGHVAVGQPVTLRLEARPDLDIRGKVSRIARTVRQKSWRVPAKVFRVEITLDRTDADVMRPEMRFRGEVETDRVPKSLLIPREAAFSRSGGTVVFVRNGFRWVPRAVRLGRSNKKLVEVVDGLREGESILPLDPERLADGGAKAAGGPK